MNLRDFFASVAGELIAPSNKCLKCCSPATQLPVGRVAALQAKDAVRALCAAEKALPRWALLPVAQRADWMVKLADALEQRCDEVVDVLMAETGKPLGNAQYDFSMLVDCLRFYAREVQLQTDQNVPDHEGVRQHTLISEPRGVVVGFLAWNFPLLNVGYKIGPALAAGCPIILKPSSVTPLATTLVGEIAHQIGFPTGVLQIVTGSASVLGPVLCESKIPAMITMIGSTKSGCQVMQASATSVKHFSLELGGNAPVLVYPDADIDLAVSLMTGLKYENCGQICVSPNRVFIHEDVYDAFVTQAAAAAKAVKLGWGREPGIKMGPLMTARDRDRFLNWINQSVDQGATLLCGGRVPQGKAFEKGYWVEPTVLGDVRPGHIVYDREVFGPVLSCIRWKDGEDEIAMANDTEFGLAAYVFTRNTATAEHAARHIRAGNICLNEVYYDLSLPHGGMKQSGVGYDCSAAALGEYRVQKRVTKRL